MKSPKFLKYKHSGIVTDLPPEDVGEDQWTSGTNIEFIQGATIRTGGYSTFSGTLSGAPIFTIQCVAGGTPHWIYCTTNKVYVTNGTTHSDITPIAGLTSCEIGDWTGCVIGGIPVLNNTKNAPIFWNLTTTNPCTTIPNFPANSLCKVIRCFKYHLFALNITTNGIDYPSTIWWSSAAPDGVIPSEWTPTTTNDAGDVSLSDTQGIIVDALPMRDTLVVYKDFSTYILSYIAGNYVFDQRKAFLTSGIKSNHCIIEVDGNHWVFTGDDLIKHDGQTFESVLNYKVKNEITNSINLDKVKLTLVVDKQIDNQVWVCIPESDNDYLTKAYVINTVDGSIGNRLLPNIAYIGKGVIPTNVEALTWDTDTARWVDDTSIWSQSTYTTGNNALVMCAPTITKLLEVDSTGTANGSPISCLISKESMPIENEKMYIDSLTRKLILKLIPNIKGQSGDIINISVGGQAYFGNSITWSQPQPFVIGTDSYVCVNIEGRFISVKFEATTEAPWKLFGYSLETVILGIY